MDWQGGAAMGDAEAVVREVESIARQAGDLALRHFGRAAPNIKADASYVTAADRGVEEFIRRELSTRFPHESVIGEEYGHDGFGLSEQLWAVDPIDGTTNFVAGLPHWAVCIARISRRRPVLGVVCAPALGELCSAAAGCGATVNGRRISLVPSRAPENEQLLAVWSTAFRSISIDFPGKLRVLGSTVMKFLYAARGSYIGALTPEVHVWDVAAGLPVLWEAGGESRTFDGGRYKHMDLSPERGFLVPPLVLASPELQGRVRAMIRPLGRDSSEVAKGRA